MIGFSQESIAAGLSRRKARHVVRRSNSADRQNCQANEFQSFTQGLGLRRLKPAGGHQSMQNPTPNRTPGKSYRAPAAVIVEDPSPAPVRSPSGLFSFLGNLTASKSA